MRILLTGAGGQLGAYLLEHLRDLNHEVIAWSGSDVGPRSGRVLELVDLLDERATIRALDRADPDTILHAAAVSAAEAVRLDLPRAEALNIHATARLADWATRKGRRLVFTSTDLVFEGIRSWNVEDDPAEPIVAYGRTKREAEPSVLAVPGGLVARLPLLFGPTRCGRPYFFDRALEAIGRGEPQTFFEDEYRTPLDLRTAASTLIRLVDSDLVGRLHVAGAERLSRFDLMRRSAVAFGLDATLVRPGRRADVALPEPRPADVSLDTTRLMARLPDLDRPGVVEALNLIQP